MFKFGSCKTILVLCVFCAASAMNSPAQTFTTLATLNGANDGSGPCPSFLVACPEGGLVQGTDGNFYGVTYAGGTSTACTDGCGTVFSLNPGGKIKTLHSFEGADGANPTGALIQGTDGNFYGTTYGGGTNGYGTVFKMNPAGTLTPLYSFCAQANCTDGSWPVAGLVQATNGNLYGTTALGGASSVCNFGGGGGCGTVFEISRAGKLTTLWSFCSQSPCTDGAIPTGVLVQGTDGNLYGTTFSGTPSAPFPGSVFKISLTGKLTTLYKFCTQSGCTDGQSPAAGLIQGADGDFYGTTTQGGANDSCAPDVDSEVGCGTVFKITAKGTLTTLYSFCTQSGCSDGEQPFAPLVQGTDGNFYGTTFTGTTTIPSYGTVFEIAPSGTLTTLHTFCTQSGCPDGSNPLAGLLQSTNGTFYGTTSTVCGPAEASVCGAASTNGTVFSLSVGLGPFVETNPTSGKVGTPVIILGNNLKVAAGVTFNGTPATITSDSNTEIKTTVPSGATTGYVEVTTASGKILTSNVKFHVLP